MKTCANCIAGLKGECLAYFQNKECGIDNDYLMWVGEEDTKDAIKCSSCQNNKDGICGVEFCTHPGGTKDKYIPIADKEWETNPRDHNVGTSDYATHKIQPWDIWLEYDLDPWDADIIKRVLRRKEGESRRLDYEKIIHVAQEKIRQIDAL